MRGGFWEIVPIIIIFPTIAYVVKLFLDNSTRKKLIEKGMVDENVKFLYVDQPTSQVLSALKWGMVAIGLGLAIFIGQLVNSSIQEEVTIGCMFMFGGLALVIYYPIASKMLQKNKNGNNYAKPQ
jgi:hypothetical protein